LLDPGDHQVPREKVQATSCKRQASGFKRYADRVTSYKQQATSNKQQASSVKRQAGDRIRELNVLELFSNHPRQSDRGPVRLDR